MLVGFIQYRIDGLSHFFAPVKVLIVPEDSEAIESGCAGFVCIESKERIREEQ